MAQTALAFETLVSPKLKTTSLCIARDFRKEHKNVLKNIRELIEAAPEWGMLNFKQTPYMHPQNGQTYHMYEITRDGFAMLVMGFTGKRAFEWKLKYLKAFNAMEAELHGRIPATAQVTDGVIFDRIRGLLGQLTAEGRKGYFQGMEWDLKTSPDGLEQLIAYMTLRQKDETRISAAWLETDHLLNIANSLIKGDG